MTNFLTLICALLVVVACGKKEVPEGMTRVLFKNENDAKSIQAYSLNKGMVVYGMNTTQGKTAAGWGNNIGHFISNNAEIILPNGTYKFFALGYDDNGTPGNDAFNTNSKVFCGEGNGGQDVTLSGGVVSVAIALSDSNDGSNCADAFAGSDFRTNSPNTNSFKNFNIVFCNNSGVTTNSGCAAGTASGIGSAEIKVTGYDKIKNNMDFDFGKAIPGCISTSGTATVSFGRKIPYRMPFHFQVKTWSGGSCGGSQLGIYDFPNGIEGAPNNAPNITNTNSGATVNMYMKQ